MNQKTQQDLIKITELTLEIRKLEDQIKEIKSNCKHLDFVPRLIETFKFDLKCFYECPVCGYVDRETKVKKEDEMLAWEADFEYLSKEEIEEIVRRGGYNFPSLPAHDEED